MKPDLSICIPTYNFGHLIGETLDTIIPQLTGEVEIVVVDGAATDATTNVVQRYINLDGRLRYFRLEAKGGIDVDMAQAVSLTKGRYCWLFSADDYMKAGAVTRVLQEIKSNPGVMVCRHWNCNYDMTPINEHPVLRDQKDATYNLANSYERLAYFRAALSSEAFFSFMSGLVISRHLWDMAPLRKEFIGSCWAHSARLMELMSNGFTVKYLSDSYILRRGDNDSFMDQGVVNRYRIAIEGYHRIAEHFFGADSEEAFHMRRVIRQELPLRYFIYAKYMTRRNPDRESIDLLDEIAEAHFSDRSLRNTVSYLTFRLLPAFVCEWAYRCYRRFIR